MKNYLSSLVLIFLITGCSRGPIVKASLDAKVDQLCAGDGGTRVFETVYLEANAFNEYGEPKIWRESRFENNKTVITDDTTTLERPFWGVYRSIWETKYLMKGNPSMSRSHFQIIRRSDGKLLGETVSYGRGGGDLPGPWHDSSYRCPNNPPDLFKSVFLRIGTTNPNPSLQGTPASGRP